MKEDFDYGIFRNYVDDKINKAFSEELNPALERHYKLGYEHGLSERKLRDRVLYFCLGLGVSILGYLAMTIFVVL